VLHISPVAMQELGIVQELGMVVVVVVAGGWWQSPSPPQIGKSLGQQNVLQSIGKPVGQQIPLGSQIG